MFSLLQETTPIYQLLPEQQVTIIISMCIIIFGVICFGLYYYFKEKEKEVLKNVARSFTILSIVAYVILFFYVCYSSGKDIIKERAEAETTIIQQEEQTQDNTKYCPYCNSILEK